MKDYVANDVDAPFTATTLCGRFMLLPETREGGMGTVQKAVDLQYSKFAAIKRMKQSGDPERSRTSFNREVDALQLLKH